MASRYFERMVKRLKTHLADKTQFTKADLEAAIKRARAEAGGLARAEKQAGGRGDAAGAALADLLTSEGSYEDEISEISDEVKEKYGDRACVIATWPDHVVICVFPDYADSFTANEMRYFDIPYSEDEATETITFGQPREMDRLDAFEPVGSDDTTELDDAIRRVIQLAGTTSKPWDGSASRYADTDAYCKACLIDENDPGAAKVQSKCKLPVYEPDGTLNLNALRAASGAHGIGAVTGVSAAAKAAAQKKLDSLKSKHGIGEAGSKSMADYTPHEPLNGSHSHAHPANGAQGGDAMHTHEHTHAGDASHRHSHAQSMTDHGFVVALRLADANGVIPAWQQYHKIGDWAVPHGVAGKIQFTRDMGDSIIRNFRANVLRRGVPLDEGHGTDSGGHALAWAEQFAWGNEGDGLPGYPEPSGSGDVLFVKLAYNDLGQHKLANRHYQHQSPQYDLDYVDKEAGVHYGPTALALGCTNNPYLRLQSLQGQPAPEPVLLEDGLSRPHGQGVAIMPELAEVQKSLEDTRKELADYRAQLETERKALSDERERRKIEAVTAFADRMIRDGVAPAVMTIARKILLQSDEGAAKVISLSDEADAEPTLNLHEAVKALIAEFPKTPFNAVTRQTDTRPNNKALDDQIDTAAKSIVDDFGLGGIVVTVKE